MGDTTTTPNPIYTTTLKPITSRQTTTPQPSSMHRTKPSPLPALLPPGVTASTTRMTTSSSSSASVLPPFTVVSRRTTSSVSSSAGVNIKTPISHFSFNQGLSDQNHPAPHLRPSLLKFAAKARRNIQLDSLKSPTKQEDFKVPPINPPSTPLLPSTRDPPPNFEDVLRIPRSNPLSYERIRRHFRHLYRRSKRQADLLSSQSTNTKLSSISRRRRLRTGRNFDTTTVSSIIPVSLLSPNDTSSFSVNTNIGTGRSNARSVFRRPHIRGSSINVERLGTNHNSPSLNEQSNRKRGGFITSRGRFRSSDQDRRARLHAVGRDQNRQTHPTLRVISSPLKPSLTADVDPPRNFVPDDVPTTRKRISTADVIADANIRTLTSDAVHSDGNVPNTNLRTDNKPEINIQNETVTEAPVTEAPLVFPVTGFSCADKILGGLYADVEADCVMYHICTEDSEKK